MTNDGRDLLAPATSMGAVTLRVGDLDAMTVYYRDAVGLVVQSSTPDSVTLGRRSVAILRLEHAPQLRHAGLWAAGLFHTAILFDTREALAAAVYSIATRHPGSFTGSADHLVSLAFYFTDPEGNGVELYWDRDRTQWSWVHGAIEMGTFGLDPKEFLQANLGEAGMTDRVTEGARVGHVHLQVGDVATAREFYVDRLGFETTASLGPQALFVSAGGYHHHMAMNTWNSRGAGRRAPTLGLARVEIEVPNPDDVGALEERLAYGGIETRNDGAATSFDDPWGNVIRVSVADR